MDEILIDGDTSNMGGMVSTSQWMETHQLVKTNLEMVWTPIGFGGSVELDKATGALPILNTNEAGTVWYRSYR